MERRLRRDSVVATEDEIDAILLIPELLVEGIVKPNESVNSDRESNITSKASEGRRDTIDNFEVEVLGRRRLEEVDIVFAIVECGVCYT